MPKKQSPKKVQKKLPQKPQPSSRQETQTLDASGKILGRLTTEVAILLRGKNKPSFRPNLLCGDKVVIVNAAKIRVTGNKMLDKKYYRHSGYMGHLKTQTMAELFRKNPSEIIRRAVRGMLPKNKLQARWMNNLKIYNGDTNG